MRYLLDTSVCVQLLRGDQRTAQRLSGLSPEETALSAMTVAELRYGALKGRASESKRVELSAFLSGINVLPFDDASAEHHAAVRHALALAGTSIGERDLVIAATALAHGLVVATGNAREFRRVPGLGVEEWG